MKILQLLIILTVFSSYTCLGNDGHYLGDASSVFASQSSDISMLEETIQIKLSGKAAKADKSKRPYVAFCKFKFQNMSDKKITIKMGFPNWQAHSENFKGDLAISWFKTRIAGKEIPTESVDLDEQKSMFTPGAQMHRYKKVFLWPVTFAPKQIIEVENEYFFGGWGNNLPVEEWGSRGIGPRGLPLLKDDFFWSSTGRGPKDRGFDFSENLASAVMYIVTTGLSWLGPIGKATISIEYGDYVFPHLLIPIPGGAQLYKNRIEWHFKNWRPDREVGIYELHPLLGRGDPKLNDLPIFDVYEHAEHWVGELGHYDYIDPPVLELLSQMVLAKYNHDFSQARVSKYFDQCDCGYKPKKGFDAKKVISLEDKKILKLLSEAKKKYTKSRKH